MAAEAVSKRLDVPLTPGDCLIIEDAPSVIATTREVGFLTLGVATSHSRDRLTHAHGTVDRLMMEEVSAVLPGLRLVTEPG